MCHNVRAGPSALLLWQWRRQERPKLQHWNAGMRVNRGDAAYLHRNTWGCIFTENLFTLFLWDIYHDIFWNCKKSVEQLHNVLIGWKKNTNLCQRHLLFEFSFFRICSSLDYKVFTRHFQSLKCIPVLQVCFPALKPCTWSEQRWMYRSEMLTLEF